VSTTAERFDSVARAAGLLALLFAWTLFVVSALGYLLPDGLRAQQLLRMAGQQLVAIGMLTAVVSGIRRGRVTIVPTAPGWWWVGPLLAIFGTLTLVPITEVWATHVLDVSPPVWWKQVVDMSSVSTAASTILVLAIIPPVCEELFFRGVLFDELHELGSVSAISLQAIAFAVYHLDLYGLPSYILLGILFGWLRWRVGMAAAIGAHVVNNLLAIAWLDGWFVGFEGGLPWLFSISAVGLLAGIVTLERALRL
jgi:membrane protease YdiL (CAAX protease family)